MTCLSTHPVLIFKRPAGKEEKRGRGLGMQIEIVTRLGGGTRGGLEGWDGYLQTKLGTGVTSSTFEGDNEVEMFSPSSLHQHSYTKNPFNVIGLWNSTLLYPPQRLPLSRFLIHRSPWLPPLANRCACSAPVFLLCCLRPNRVLCAVLLPCCVCLHEFSKPRPSVSHRVGHHKLGASLYIMCCVLPT